MSRFWNKAWNNTPRIDCGLCGLSTCASFTRALGASFVSLDDCPILQLPEFENQHRELEKFSEQSKNARVRPAPDLPEGGILLTKPCKDTDEKVLAEMRVYNGVEARSPQYFSVFDPNTLCDILECFSNQFDLIKCSRDLGYARADVEDRSITILQDGRINMRRIKDSEQVASMFSEIERSIIGSIICNCCGADLLSILTGFVNPKSGEHTVLSSGSTFNMCPEVANQNLSREKMLSLKNQEIIEISDIIDGLKDYLRDIIDKVLSMQLEQKEENPRIEEVRCMLVNNLSNIKNSDQVTYLLKALALVWAICDAILGLQKIREILESISPTIKEDLLKYLSLARNGTLSTSEKCSQQLLLGFAHIARINRAMVLLKKWSG
jgi:ArsR family metal-binding transcriptional regulator